LTEARFATIALEGNAVLGENAQCTLVDDEIKPKTLIDKSTHSEGVPLSDDINVTKIGSFNDLVVIPQSTRSLTITYQFVSQKGSKPDGSDDIVVTETKDIPLKYNDAGDPWKAGVHYTYNIIIGTKEILVSPTVDDWDPVTVPSVSL
jgi:hypothetical protein